MVSRLQQLLVILKKFYKIWKIQIWLDDIEMHNLFNTASLQVFKTIHHDDFIR